MNPDLLASLLEQFKAQEDRIAALEGDQRADAESSSRKTDLGAENIDEVEGHGSTLQQDSSKFIPQVRKCNLVQFKNRFGAEEDRFAVDVLEGNSFFDQDLEDEIKLRQLQASRKNHKDSARGRPSRAKVKPRASLTDQSVHASRQEGKWIARIRIQSPTLISILSKVMRESWTGQPRTFIRPFSPLIYFHKEVVEVLKVLEARWGSPENSYQASGCASETTSGRHTPNAKFPVDDSPVALAQLRCYVRLIEDEILPLHTKFEHLDYSSNEKVRFQDLWYLFRTGEFIYRPVGIASDKDSSVNNILAAGNRTWRVYGIRPPWPKDAFTPSDYLNYHVDDDDDEKVAFGVHCYMIDYTGEEFCAVTETFKIQPFEGEKPITSLKIFPYRFLPDHEQVLARYTEISKDFLHYVETKHASYDWWTMTRDPRGEPAVDVDGEELKRPEYVSSEVIIDFIEAFQHCPDWKPKRSVMKYMEPNPFAAADPFTIDWWSDADRTELLARTTEIIALRSAATAYESNEAMRQDAFLSAVRENDKNGRPTARHHLRDCDLALLPVRVFGYVLQDLKFAQLDAQKLTPVTKSYDAFDSLKIDRRDKDLIERLVGAHFLAKAGEKKGQRRITQDVIQGKGKGLFILLHGVPGVGKSATAEAVAQANGKPLFTITAGDVGLAPDKVEAALRRIFRLAHAWDCVLLLDEVDTFFSQRSKGDVTITKNALVSGKYQVLVSYTTHFGVVMSQYYLIMNSHTTHTSFSSLSPHSRVLQRPPLSHHQPRRLPRRSLQVSNPPEALLPTAQVRADTRDLADEHRPPQRHRDPAQRGR